MEGDTLDSKMRLTMGLWGMVICNGHLNECTGPLDDVSFALMLEATDVQKLELLFASESWMTNQR